MKAYVLTIYDQEAVYEKYSKLLGNVCEIIIVQGKQPFLDINDFYTPGSKLLYARELNEGEKFCSLGHRFIYNDIYNCSEDWALVLEDDAVLDPGIRSFIKEVSKLNMGEPAVLILGHSKTVKKNIWVQQLKQPSFNLKEVGTKVFGERDADLFGTVGYMINGQAAQVISEYNLWFWKADHWSIYKNMGVKILHMESPIIWEAFLTKDSLTKNPNYIHHNLFSTHFLTEVRAIINAQIKRLLR